MIGTLRGVITFLEKDHLIIETNGIGYLIYTHTRLLSNLTIGTTPLLWIDMHLREEGWYLYGFENLTEKTLFRLLLTVKGVGAKMGLALLGTYSSDAIEQAILSQNTPYLTEVSGIGPKLAQRIIHELRDKITIIPPPSLLKETTLVQEALTALVHLGYSRQEARSALENAQRNASFTLVEELIRAGLKELL